MSPKVTLYTNTLNCDMVFIKVIQLNSYCLIIIATYIFVLNIIKFSPDHYFALMFMFSLWTWTCHCVLLHLLCFHCTTRGHLLMTNRRTFYCYSKFTVKSVKLPWELLHEIHSCMLNVTHVTEKKTFNSQSANGEGTSLCHSCPGRHRPQPCVCSSWGKGWWGLS